ncbi:MAG: hypothetical protein WD294_15150 [Phycisphaeraceae bacterium]
MAITQPGTRRIGEILVSQGVLTEAQVQDILNQQHRHGRPFGELAEQLFDVGPEQVEKAWIEQYLDYGTEVDLEQQVIDVDVLRVINRRQAWQFRVLPLSRADGELVAATSREDLRRAVNFAWRRFDEPVYFLIASRPQLEAFLMKHYPWASAPSLLAAG